MSFTPAAMGNQYTSSQGSPSLRVSHRGRLAGAPEHPVDSGSKSYPGQRGVVHGRGWGVGVGIPAAATGTPGYLPNLTSGSIQAVQVKHCILNLWLSLVNISRRVHTPGTILMLMESQLPGPLLNLSLKGISLLLSWGWGSNGATLRLMMEFSGGKGGVSRQGTRGGDKYWLF